MNSYEVQGKGTAKGSKMFLKFLHTLLRNFEIPTLVLFACLPVEAFVSDETYKLVLLTLGTLLFFLGIVLRLWSRGYEKRGRFVLDGPYRHVQNPDEVGSMSIYLGWFSIFGVQPTWTLSFAIVCFAYFTIVSKAYDEGLRMRVGAMYDRYSARVRRWIPSLLPGVNRSGVPFSLKRSLKEDVLFVLWILGMVAIVVVRKWWFLRETTQLN